jgi:hypothetical protein
MPGIHNSLHSDGHSVALHCRRELWSFAGPNKSTIADCKQKIYFTIVSKTFELVRDLVEHKEVIISDHGYDELAEEAIAV